MTQQPRAGVRALAGLPNPRAWSQVRPGEVVRVVHTLAAAGTVVVDVAGSLDGFDAAGTTRGRNAVARALVVEAGVLVGVCAATPIGVTRFLSWAVEATSLAPDVPMIVAVNRAPGSRFRRGELFEEITRSLPPSEVVFVPDDDRVALAVWDGAPVTKGPFVRAVSDLAARVGAVRPRTLDGPGAGAGVLEGVS